MIIFHVDLMKFPRNFEFWSYVSHENASKMKKKKYLYALWIFLLCCSSLLDEWLGYYFTRYWMLLSDIDSSVIKVPYVF